MPKKVARLFLAFGEEKTIWQWFRDDRCEAGSYDSLYYRLRSPKWSNEDAIRTPRQRKGQPVPTITAWNEEKTIWEWLQDDRCVVKTHGALLARIGCMTPEAALTTPPFAARRTNQAIIDRRRYAVELYRLGMPRPEIWELFKVSRGAVDIWLRGEPKRRPSFEPVAIPQHIRDFIYETMGIKILEPIPTEIKATLAPVLAKPRTIPEIRKAIPTVTPDTVRQWELKGWVKAVDTLPVRYRLAA